jgi:hypothetical protein
VNFGPKIAVEKDETLSQYLQNVIRSYQSSLLDLRHPKICKSREFCVTLFLGLFVNSGHPKENSSKKKKTLEFHYKDCQFLIKPSSRDDFLLAPILDSLHEILDPNQISK